MLRLVCNCLVALLSLAVMNPLYAGSSNIVNVYTFGEEIPDSVIAQFEKETGIKVNYSSFETNEIMYSKLRATNHPGYDVVASSNYAGKAG